MAASNWITVAESTFPREREALEFVRSQLPKHEPYRAWSNFEFIADDGTINEVDLLVFSPRGLFLVEIKSRPGRLLGDAGTWTWEKDGKLTTTDNPLILANSKAKKLRCLLQRQKAAKKRDNIPFIDALVFCSADDLRCELRGTAKHRVCLRDRPAAGDKPARPGIMAAIKRRDCPGVDPGLRDKYDNATARIVTRCLSQAGIRQSQRGRKVGDYLLEQLIDEGPGYQDWQATHTTLNNVRRRVRIYNIRTGASAEERQTIERAARREGELLETLQHQGILRREGFTEHELGPALIFEHDPNAIRLDHYLAENHANISVDQRLDLVRQLADVVRFAHQKRVVHRALSPRSILINADDPNRPRLKVFNWQVGYRDGSGTTGGSQQVSATSHVDRLVEDVSTAYMAPEALTDDGSAGEHLDVFSLGAIAYHVFSGQPPAADGLELGNKLRESKGLRISSVLNGAGETLQELIHWATLADVGQRVGLISTVDDFVDLLDKVEEEAAAPSLKHFVDDPNRVKKDDLLVGGYKVLQRLGRGASSIGLLIEKDEVTFVLKAACDPGQNSRLKDEADVINKLRHQHVVEFCGECRVGDHYGFLMRPVMANIPGEDRSKKTVETLGKRLRREGRLHVDLLQRFGEDLLGVVNYLEEQGIPHRDIKPDNIAIGHIGGGKRLHLVLFDFSLSRTPADNIRAGTIGYLDPLLPLRKPPRWDLHAERYAAAATLYELAAGPGNLPKWGEGASAAHVDYEATIDGDLFDASLRDNLTDFFTRAFRRDPSQRFDNAEQMVEAWRDCFVGIDAPGTLTEHDDESEPRKILADATFDTLIQELGLGTRATNALDRANVLTVEDLLTIPSRKLMKQRGVGNKTRREILAAVRILRKRLGEPPSELTTIAADNSIDEGDTSTERLSVDRLAEIVIKPSAREGDTARATLLAVLGLDHRIDSSWPSQTDVYPVVDVTRGRIAQLVGKFQTRWAKEPSLTKLRSEIVDLLAPAGGVMSAAELAEAILVARGSVRDEPDRTKIATAVARAAVEVERTLSEPRFIVRRDKGRVLIATSQERATYAGKLGDEADKLADEDPLVPPARAIQRLRGVSVPTGVDTLTDARIVRLAAAASHHAVVSSRQELYPAGMAAERALKLSQGALYGVPFLTAAQIHERVASRYPDAEPLPQRPELDALLQSAGFDFQWDAAARAGGGYVSRFRDSVSITSGSDSVSRLATSATAPTATEVTPEIADARQLEEKLERAVREGSFIALMVSPKSYELAIRNLSRFPVEIVDFEGVFISALRDTAQQAKVNWDLVLKTDAKPHEGDWDKLMLLVGRAMPTVEAEILENKSSNGTGKTVLLTYAGMLARYEKMSLFEQLREAVTKRDGLHGVWILVPGDDLPLMDGKAIPLLGSGQCTRIPTSWLRNEHRTSRSQRGPARECHPAGAGPECHPEGPTPECHPEGPTPDCHPEGPTPECHPEGASATEGSPLRRGAP